MISLTHRSGLRLVAAMLVLAVAAVAALAAPSRADAYVGPNPVLDPTKWSEVVNLLKAPPAVGSGAAGPALVEAELVAGGLTWGQLVPAIGALGVGVLIGGTADHYFHISCRIASTCEEGTLATNFTFGGWKHVNTNEFTSSSPYGTPEGYYAKVTYTGGYTSCISSPGLIQYWWNPNGSDSCKTVSQTIESALSSVVSLGASTPIGSGYYYFWYLNGAQFGDGLTIDESGPHTNQPYTKTINPSTFPTDPESSAAGAVVGALLSGDHASDYDVGKRIDPEWEGDEFNWLAPSPLETYTAYLARLRAAGWVGTATVVDLDQYGSDPNYGAGGVPCTSVIPNATVTQSTAVTFYRNASTFDGSPIEPNAWCGNVNTNDECDFASDEFSWYGPLVQQNLAFYEEACADAWDYLRTTIDAFDSSGKLKPEYVEAADPVVPGPKIKDTRVKNALWPPQSGYTVNDWEKAETETFYFTHPFVVHFYRLVDASDSSDYGVKIKFTDLFTP